VFNKHRKQNYDLRKHGIHPLISKRHNDVIDVITKKYELKYRV